MTYEIARGASARPVKCVVYGPEGVGKTTFASKWPNAVFIDVEDGSGHYDVARLPRPESWVRLLDEIAWCSLSNDVGTVVIDTADAAEELCVRKVLADKNLGGIEDAGYGKGYTYLAEEFSKLFDALDACVEEGKNVVVLAHSQIRKFEQPDEMGAYDRWELKLSKKCAPQLKEWCDVLLFANFKTEVVVSKDGKKAKAEGGKKRVMHASHSATWDAKNRLGLPDELPFDFSAIAEKVASAPGPVNTYAPEPMQAEAAATPSSNEPTKRTNPMEGLDVTVFEDATPPEIHKLHELMDKSSITIEQLQRAVGKGKNNPYTVDTPIGEYDPAFIREVLIAHWEQIADSILPF